MHFPPLLLRRADAKSKDLLFDEDSRSLRYGGEKRVASGRMTNKGEPGEGTRSLSKQIDPTRKNTKARRGGHRASLYLQVKAWQDVGMRRSTFLRSLRRCTAYERPVSLLFNDRMMPPYLSSNNPLMYVVSRIFGRRELVRYAEPAGAGRNTNSAATVGHDRPNLTASSPTRVLPQTWVGMN